VDSGLSGLIESQMTKKSLVTAEGISCPEVLDVGQRVKSVFYIPV